MFALVSRFMLEEENRVRDVNKEDRDCILLGTLSELLGLCEYLSSYDVGKVVEAVAMAQMGKARGA